MNAQNADGKARQDLQNCRPIAIRRSVGGILVCLLIAAGIWSVRETAFAQVSTPPANRPNPIPPKEKPKEPKSDQPLLPSDPGPRDLPDPFSLPDGGLALPEPTGLPKGVVEHNVLFEERPIQRRIFAPRDAVVREIHVKEGQTVKKGDLLVKLTSSDLEREIIKTEADLEKAKAKLSELQEKKAGMKRLSKKAELSRNKLLHVTTKLKLAEIKLSSYEEQLDLLTRSQKELMVHAPVTGVIEPPSWHEKNLKAHLLGCPVKRGEYLFDIGPLPEPKNKANQGAKFVPDTNRE